MTRRSTRAGMVQIDLNAEELDKLDAIMAAYEFRSRSAFFRYLLSKQPIPQERTR